MKRNSFVAGIALAALALAGAAQDGAAKKTEAPAFLAGAEADAAFEKALARAEADNKRVCVVWSGEDPAAAAPLLALLKRDKTLSRLVLYEYEVVAIDIVKASDPLISRTGMPGRPKGPWISVHDTTGKKMMDATPAPDYAKDPAPFGKGLAMILEERKADPVGASKVFAAALAEAAASSRRVLVHLGAPW